MMKKLEYEYDVFISHAVEDKIPIANQLYQLLKEQNLNVWYSGRELSVGDRLTPTIHNGMDKCRFGVVIISPTYLSKIWALNEFFFLLTREKNGDKVVLPVLYDITPEELAYRSPLMADIFAVRADKGLEHVANALSTEIKKQYQLKKSYPSHPMRLMPVRKTSILTGAIFLLLAIISHLLIPATIRQDGEVEKTNPSYPQDRIPIHRNSNDASQFARMDKDDRLRSNSSSAEYLPPFTGSVLIIPMRKFSGDSYRGNTGDRHFVNSVNRTMQHYAEGNKSYTGNDEPSNARHTIYGNYLDGLSTEMQPPYIVTITVDRGWNPVATGVK
jgi:hypothetical protein